MANTWYDTFTAANGTVVNGGSYTANSGGTYSVPTGLTSVNMVIESDAAYSATTGSYAYALYSTALGINDPVSVTFTYTGTNYNVGVIYRTQSNGNGYIFRLANNGTLNFQRNTSSGTTEIAYINSITLTSGDSYTMTVCPWNIEHSLYLYNNTTSQWINSSGTGQTAKVAIMTVGDCTTLAGGYPGFFTASGSGAGITVTGVSGGPAIAFPTTLNAVRVTDLYVDLYCMSQEGGKAPLTYVLQRKTGAGSYSNIATITPGTHYYDYTVSPSTSYTYQVAVTDSSTSPVTTDSNSVAVTTLASQSWTRYSMSSGSTTALNNGTQWTDTTGAAIAQRHPYVFWDQRYQQYFLLNWIPSYTAALYASEDLLNWTPLGDVWNSATIDGSSAYSSLGNFYIHPHPTNGLYYLFIKGGSSSIDNVYYVYSGSTPLTAGTTYVAGPLTPGYVTTSSNLVDTSIWLDPGTGTLWIIYSLNGDADSGSYQTVYAEAFNSTWSALSGTTYVVNPNNWSEAPAPARRDRVFGLGTSYTTIWEWNPNKINFGYDPSSYTYEYPGSTMFTTAATPLAAPAGAGPWSGDESMPYGYGGSIENLNDFEGYTGGTAAGIDPVASYGSQVWQQFKTQAGQWIWMADRWDSTGSTSSTMIWLPMTIDSYGQPTIPWTSSFVPQAGTYSLTGPTSGTAGIPSTNFTLTPNGAITDTVTLSDGGAGGTFKSGGTTVTSLTFSNSSSAQTFTYTAASAGAKTITLSSGDGYTISGEPITYTATTEPTYTLTGPSSGYVGQASTAFTLTPSASVTDTVSLSDGGAGGTFKSGGSTVTSLTFSNSSTAQTFTYTPATTGAKTLTLTSSDTYPVSGSPATYTSNALPTYTLTGPSSGYVGQASTTFTLTPSTAVSDTVTLSDGGAGGTFRSGGSTVTSLSFSNSATPQTFTYTASSSGAKTLTLSSGDGYTVTGSPATYTASAQPTYGLTGPSTGYVGQASSTFTLTPSTSVTDTVTLSDGGAGGTFRSGGTTVTSLSFSSSSSAQGFTYTAASAGAKTISLTSGDGWTITGSPATYTASNPASDSYTLTGPSTGEVGVASSNFTVTPSTSVTDTVTFSDGGAGGTFTPASLTFSNSSSAQTFTYTAASAGAKTITLTSGDSYTVTNSPWTYTASEGVSWLYFDSWVSGLPSGYASSATVVPRLYNGTAISDVASGSYSVGPVVESSDQAGAYACRVAVATSVLPAGVTVRVAWSVDGTRAVDQAPRPPSAALDGGLSWGQALNQILAGVVGVLSGVPSSGAGTLLFQDPGGENDRVSMAVSGTGNRTSVEHTPPVA